MECIFSIPRVKGCLSGQDMINTTAPAKWNGCLPDCMRLDSVFSTLGDKCSQVLEDMTGKVSQWTACVQDHMHLECMFSTLGDKCCLMLEDMIGTWLSRSLVHCKLL